MQNSLRSLYFTAFNSDLGDSIVLIFFPALILDVPSLLCGMGASQAYQGAMLGLLLAAYPLGQLLGAPLIGALSDRHGRKKILNTTMLILALSFILSGVAIHIHALWLLFMSRLLGGFAAVNLTLSRAMLADVKDQAIISRRIAMSTFAQGSAWVLGALFGIPIGASAIIDRFDPAFPFYFVALLLVINAALVHREVEETVQERGSFKWDVFESFRSLGDIFRLPRLEIVLAAFLLGQLAYFFFFIGLPSFEMERFQATTSKLAIIYLIMAVAFNIGALLVLKLKTVPLKKIIVYPVLLSLVVSISILFTRQQVLLYTMYGIFSLMSGLYFCHQLTLISQLAGEENHGKAFGAAQSCTTFAQMIGPVITGTFIVNVVCLPIVISALLCCLSLGLFLFFFRKARASALINI
jgi:MFS transporter, DHA1 family, tetracycline resistance protein